MATVEHRPLTSGDEESSGHSPGMSLLFDDQYRLRQQPTTVMRAVILLAVALALIVVVTPPVTKDHSKLTTNSVAPLSRRRALGLPNIFGVKRPEISIGNVTLSQVHFEIVGGAPRLDMALTATVTVKNPNRMSLDYDESLTTINYDGTTLAEATVPSGSCPADGMVQMTASINVMADRLLSVPSIIPHLLTGIVPLTSVTVISGRVTVLPFIRIRVRLRSTCDLEVSVKVRTVRTVSCRTNIEL